MISKKILFSFILSISFVQSIYSAENATDRIFSLLQYPGHLIQYLIDNPNAIHATIPIPVSSDTIPISVLKFALMYNSDSQTIEILLNAGANPNDMFSIPNINGNLLHYLAHRYNTAEHRYPILRNKIAEIAALLILSGADASQTDSQNRKPIEISPELMTHVNTIIQAKEKEKLAHAALMTELRPNTQFATELASLLGLDYSSVDTPQ